MHPSGDEPKVRSVVEDLVRLEWWRIQQRLMLWPNEQGIAVVDRIARLSSRL